MQRFFIATTVLLLMLLSLCSCADTIDESTEAPSATATADAQETARPDAEESVLSRSKISRTLSSGVVVDADVTAVNKDNLAAYTSSLRLFSVLELTTALNLSAQDAINSYTQYSLDALVPGTLEYLEFENSKQISCITNQFWYTTDTFQKARDLMVTEGSENNVDLFLTEKNLDFATIKQARAEVLAVLDELGISVVDDPLALTLDYESLVAENERQYAAASEQAEQYGQMKYLPEKLAFTEDDACYLLYYPVAVDGLPVSSRTNGVFGDGSWVPGTELVACYSKDGLAGLMLDYQPEVLEKSEARPVLSLEDILRTVEAKYDSLILNGDYLIYDIRLEYITRPVSGAENTYNLIPVWRFATEHTYTLRKGDDSDASLTLTELFCDTFDAVTGEELPTDVGGI